MGIVFNEAGLSQFKRPILVQEYVNHDGAIEKVPSSYSQFISLTWDPGLLHR